MSRYIPIKKMNVDKPKNESMYAPPNKYGYKINIAHPIMAQHWKRYRKSKGIPYGMPASDAERFEFERIILEAIKRKAAEKRNEI